MEKPLSMSVGIWQVILILLIILIIFGAGKLPKVMEDLGRGVSALKRGINEEENVNDKNNKKNT